jgi:hypothetical protein
MTTGLNATVTDWVEEEWFDARDEFDAHDKSPVDSKCDDRLRRGGVDLSQPRASWAFSSSAEPAAPGRPRSCFNECGRAADGQRRCDSVFCCTGCRIGEGHDESCDDAYREYPPDPPEPPEPPDPDPPDPDPPDPPAGLG